MALIETHFFSEILGMDMEVNVILPQERQPYAGNGKLKVLWLLHGGSGDNTAWLRMSSIERYALRYGIAVVVPGGMNSCYTDMEHGGRYFTYIADELPHILRHLLPCLSALREDNYISGFSNGGFGCLRVGLARPELYAAIGAFSAGNKADVPFVNDGSTRSRDRIILFGDGSLTNTDNDLMYLGREALKMGTTVPRVYHACGSVDPWLDLNEMMRDFFDGLEGNPYDYQYHEAEGMGHTWEFWDMEIVRFFEYLGMEKDGTQYLGL
ncbi:S-formylglutathione hydrolase FrmB [Paenibacillus sp. 1_12]|uniref:alpha/beta hydrolase n=1 Tax=Paenibacillus sp. 1_12 TaxID=1566278 RepID=UPI0008EEFE12|nr:alpha/beta hydrolase-fold protein [Paenibacillus sp. 1_12]SFL64727.1 S-formylglutathione hydrolase FrmB [Paenibacillus sp. 1_12]